MPTEPDPKSPLVSRYRDDPDMAVLVQLFLSELPARMTALQNAWSATQLEQLARLALQLKGCCSGYGFPAIGQAAATLETRLRALDDGAQESLWSLASEYQQLMDLCSRACVPR